MPLGSQDYQRIDLVQSQFEERPVLDDISIVIPTLGRAVLETSLGWIMRGSVWPAGVTVVDQGGTDEARRWLEAMERSGVATRYIASSRTGRSAGLNEGLAETATRFVAITDDDCFVDEDWLAAMHRRLRANPATIFSGRVLSAGEQPNMATVSGLEEFSQNKPRLTFDLMSGGNMGMAMEVARIVGPFDEDPRLRTAEDCDWSYRALRAGFSLTYAPEVTLRHLAWRGEQERTAQYRSYARSHGGFYGKYIRRGDLFILARAFLHQLRCLKRWGVGLARRDAESAVNGKIYSIYLMPGIISGLSAKAPSPKVEG